MATTSELLIRYRVQNPCQSDVNWSNVLPIMLRIVSTLDYQIFYKNIYNLLYRNILTCPLQPHVKISWGETNKKEDHYMATSLSLFISSSLELYLLVSSVHCKDKEIASLNIIKYIETNTYKSRWRITWKVFPQGTNALK